MIHICFRVRDLEASETFYREAFGFEVSRRRDFPDAKFTLLYMKAPGSPFELELTYNYGRSEPYVIGDGYSHFAVSTDSIEDAHRRHEDGELHPEPIKSIGGGTKLYFLTDPDGYRVEVVQA